MKNVIRISDYQYKAMFKAEIDVAADCTIDSFMNWCEKYNLHQTLITANGPGGGNPCFEIACANKHELIMALADFHQTDVKDEFIQQMIDRTPLSDH
tara:strand:+ start:143 stop:433 length:291 start_codon:yes stop_codon:yes gene_type:complete